MNNLRLLAIASALLAPTVVFSQADADTKCRNEVANRGYSGYSFEGTRVNGNLVTGTLRSGRETLAYSCQVDNMGNVGEVRVERAGAVPPLQRQGQSPEYDRGYRDGYRKIPMNNYNSSGDYITGWNAGNNQAFRR